MNNHLSFRGVPLGGETISTLRGHRERFRGTNSPTPLGFSRHGSGVPGHSNPWPSSGSLFWLGETESGSAGTHPDKGYPGRRCAPGPKGPWLRHWLGAALWRSQGTPELCLKQSILGSRETFVSTHRFSRGALFIMYKCCSFPKPVPGAWFLFPDYRLLVMTIGVGIHAGGHESNRALRISRS